MDNISGQSSQTESTQSRSFTSERSERFQNAVELVNQCAGACNESFAGCLQAGGEHATADHLQYILDCAEACRLSAEFMQRHSPNYMDAVSLCASVARSCAHNMRSLQDNELAELCERTATACEGLTSA